MKIKKLILFEIAPLFITANFFFVVLLLLQQVVELAELLFIRSVPFTIIAETILFYLPSFLAVTIPISTILAVVLAFNRFSSDSELVAMHACGASNMTLIAPVVVVGIFAALFGLYLNISLLPKGSTLAVGNLNLMLENISINNIREKEMYTDIPGMIFYANRKIDMSNFEEILIIDTNRNVIISAQTGTIIPNSNRSIVMQFEGGKITMVDKSDEYTNMSFDKMSVNYPINLQISSMPMNEKLMGLGELRSNFPNGNLYKFEFAKRFTMPISAFVLSLLGLTLGRALHRSSRYMGIGVSAVVAVGINALFMVGESLINRFDPFLMAVMPLFIFTVITAVMLYRMVRS